MTRITQRPDLRRRARAALADRLRAQLPAGALHDGGEHALLFTDALAGTLTADDVAWAHAHLARGAKGELRPARSGAVPAHAAWSSTALVCSAFAPWRSEPSALALAGLDGFEELRLEERLHIPHGGGTPNLDVVLPAADRFVGVESKLTEHLAPLRARAWPPAYRRPAMAAELDGGWAEVFADLLEGRWAPRFLDVAQLVRHALSLRPLRSRHAEQHLVLLFWEPADGDALPEVREHRAEVAELLARLGADAVPRLHACSYAEVLEAWAPIQPEHVAALRARYDVAAGAGQAAATRATSNVPRHSTTRRSSCIPMRTATSSQLGQRSTTPAER